MTIPDFTQLLIDNPNIVIISGRQMGKNQAYKAMKEYYEFHTPKEFKHLQNQPIYYNSPRKPQYPPIPRNSNT